MTETKNRISSDDQARIWELWRGGKSLRAVGRELGHSHGRRVGRIVASTGGVEPRKRTRAACCLSSADREEISRGLARDESYRKIGTNLGRHHTTISREVERNGGRESYRAGAADQATWDRARRPKVCKLGGGKELARLVAEKLELKWSPEQIAGWLRRRYPDNEQMNVSHETIYLTLFVQSRGALRRELCSHLRTKRTTRRPKGKPAPQGRGQINDMLMISERPAAVEDRAVPGHWEGDLVLGKRPTGIATLVERTSRFTQLVALPDGYKAAPVRLALTDAITTLPATLRRSLTWDQGAEMAEHIRFSVDTGVTVYFCDPRSPWQRGSNENTNGLLRQYFPKRGDLGGVTQAHLDAVADELNGRPRKTLGYMTPAEKFAEMEAETSSS